MHFTIVGDGPALDDLTRLTAQLGLTDHVTFAGVLAGDEVYRCYDRSHLGVSALAIHRKGLHEASALKARVRQDLAAFTAEFRDRLPRDIDTVEGPDVQKYLSFFVQDTWKAWTEAVGELIAAD